MAKDKIKKVKDKTIQVSDLHYYFDAKEKDTLDGTKFCSKSRAVLALRDRLLALPDVEFSAAMKTLNGLLDQGHKKDQEKKPETKPKSQDALRLYEQGSASETSGSKITPI